VNVPCPDCGEMLTVPSDAQPGDILECPNCAGHAVRLKREDGHWTATLAHRVSCPACDEMLILPENAKAGDGIACCGRRYRLTFEYGAFAAEEAQGA
jgi:ribosomal protein S27E